MPEAQAAAPASSESGVQVNLAYFKTTPGVLKMIQLVLGVICLGLVGSRAANGFFVFAIVICFLSTIVWSVVHGLSLDQALSQLPIHWTLTELVNYGIKTVVLIIGVVAQLASLYGGGRQIAAGVFGLVNALAYGGSTYLLYKDYRGTAPAVG